MHGDGKVEGLRGIGMLCYLPTYLCILWFLVGCFGNWRGIGGGIGGVMVVV